MSETDLNQEKVIYCHRGYWNSAISQNSLESFLSAAKFGFSVETDIRYINNSAIISHDLPSDEDFVPLNNLTTIDTSFALNIKEDGLQIFFEEVRSWIESSNSFIFDGSIPEMLRYQKLGLNHALRLSEFEKSIPWQSGYIWLDSFHEDWWMEDKQVFKIFEGAQVVVVSPELHGRDPRFVWDFLSNERARGRFEFSICTDRPLEYLSWR
jgi:hypothetical protein